ncbi:immunoglobulin domain-containing protein [Horticoccus luteus]|uniref:Immunoglobulin domain-containing protein n=1 Tax=Horticoccus luteus TaxID=2862869 RepID=A0A8F9TUJ1_9BACT|nr:immunoglobulin domain-containing protein [Horticoccus luteus]QYM79529.1 immunoglobulin domain-containing protein [Horticoccus luteus]
MTLSDIPAGRFHDQVARLAAGPQARTLHQLETLHAPLNDVRSLRVDARGSLYYVCTIPGAQKEAIATTTSSERKAVMEGAMRAAGESPSGSQSYAAAAGAAVPVSAPPIRHSRPGAENVIYLNFSGYTVKGTAWNAELAKAEFDCVPYDTDSDPTTFSASEQAAIVAIWQRVAEDYRPFDVDVTTERPAVFTSRTAHALITRNTDVEYKPNPDSDTASGVAYVGVFGGADYQSLSPAFIYWNLLIDVSAIADTISHEVGHNLGLTHDGTATEEYYRGHGIGETSWGPLMGAPNKSNVTQWSKGEYRGANNPQDDIAILTGNLGRRADDAGDNVAAASEMAAGGAGWTAGGVIEANTDSDVFAFTADWPNVAITVSPDRPAGSATGGNLDVVAELLDASGTVVARADPANRTSAIIVQDVAPGRYYVRVSATGTGNPWADSPTGYTSYGSVGGYTIAVVSRPRITPARNVVAPGQAIALEGAVGGGSGLTFRWKKDGTFINGATTATLNVGNAGRGDSGAYTLEITDGNSVTRRGTAFVQVAPAQTELRMWGSNDRGQTAVPADLHTAVSVAAGDDNTLVIEADGTVLGWGLNDSGDMRVPDGLHAVVAVATAGEHALALRADGTVMSWGQADGFSVRGVPADLADVVAVATGGKHNLALKADGTVVAWGGDEKGQTDVPDGLVDVVAVAAGDEHSLALKRDGKVVAWGSNYGGATYVPTGLTNVVAISAAANGSLALKADGTVVFWGIGYNGPSNIPADLAQVSGVALGAEHVIARKGDGTVVGWGSNSFGQTDNSLGLTDVIGVAAGRAHTGALRDASRDHVPTITVGPLTQSVAEGTDVTLSVEASGGGAQLFYQWRKNGEVIAGATTATLALDEVTSAAGGSYDIIVTDWLGRTPSSPAVLTVNPLPGVTSRSNARQVLSPGDTLTLNVAATGAGALHYQWRRNGRVLAGETGATLSKPAMAVADSGTYIVEVTDDWGTRRVPFFVNVMPASTRVVMWGDGGDPALGAVPADLTDAVALAAGYRFSLALRRDGTVVGWGQSNGWGQATPPAGLTDVVAIAGGLYHALALRADGTVVAWGSRGGDALTLPSGLSDVTALAGGSGNSTSLRLNGKVATWGDGGSYGPMPANLRDVIAIASGAYHRLALKSDGTVVAWGSNTRGESTVPAGLSDVTAIAAGGQISLALRADGTVVAWGDKPFPGTQMPTDLKDVVAIAVGSTVAVALKSNGTLVTWGAKVDGANIPAAVTNTLAVAMGTAHGLALCDMSRDTAPVLTTAPADQVVAEGRDATFTVVVNGSAPLSYQWRKDGVPVAGATNATLTIVAAVPSEAGRYDVVATNLRGTVTSPAATLTVRPLPILTSWSPARQRVAQGQSFSLAAAATGTGGLHYEWRHDGRVIPGATAATFERAETSSTDGGLYTVVVTDDVGSRSYVSVVVVAPTATEVRAWGSNGYGQTNVPANLGNVVSVAAAGEHSLALQGDGKVVAWGRNAYGESTVPGALGPVVAIAGGTTFSVAVTDAGRVVAWGDNAAGQLNVPGDLSEVVAVAAGEGFIVALKADGTVRAWGTNRFGESTPPSRLGNVTAIAAGSSNALAVKADGTVIRWGSNDAALDVPADLTDVANVASGGLYAIATKRDGTVASWGGGLAPAPAGTSTVATVAVGPGHALVARTDGSVVGWANSNVPQTTPPANLANVIAVAAGNGHELALRDASGGKAPVILTQPRDQTVVEGTATILSVNASGGPSVLRYQWQKDGAEVAGATTAVLALTNVTGGGSGRYTVVVSNDLGTVTSLAATLTVRLLPVISASSAARLVIAPGQPLALFVTASGTGSLHYQWYKDGSALPGATAATYNKNAAVVTDSGNYWVEVSDEVGVRGSAKMSVLVSGVRTEIRGWGKGVGANVPAGIYDAVAVVAGNFYALALRADGTVVSWGSSYGGAAQVPAGLTNVIGLAGGSSQSYAWRADGTVVGWGQPSGEMNVPQGLSDVIALAAGDFHVLALRGDGTVVAWGNATQGAQAVPAGLAHVTAIAAGRAHSLALKSDGTVTGWGSNAWGQATPPAGLKQVVAIAAGGDLSVALKRDGTVVTWGLGAADITRPPQGLTDVVKIAAGNAFALAVRANGSVTAWGYDTSLAVSTAPALRDVVNVAGGYDFGLALRMAANDPAPVITAQPIPATAVEGSSATLNIAVKAGDSSPVFEWRKNGVSLGQSIQSQLTLTNITPADAGGYSVVVTNSGGSVTSEAVALTVVPLPRIVRPAKPRQLLRAGEPLTLAIAAEGTGTLHYQWFRNRRPIDGATQASYVRPSCTVADKGLYWVEVSDDVGLRRSRLLSVSVAPQVSAVVAWGDVLTYNLLPDKVTDVAEMAGGTQFAFYLHADGTVSVVGNPGVAHVPAGLAGVVAIGAGGWQAMAVKADGSVVQCGSNLYPAPAYLTDVVAVAAGNGHCLALRADGTVVAWGDNRNNQTTVPAGLTNVVAISAGQDSSAAVTADGTLYCWGYGGSWIVTRDAVAVATGTDATLVLKSDGTVFMQRYGSHGESSVPAGLANVAEVVAGSLHLVALKSDGTVVAWGQSSLGKTVVPAGLDRVVGIAAGSDFSLALREAAPASAPAIVTAPVGQRVLAGRSAEFRVSVVGTPALTFQWKKNGAALPGETAATLKLAAVEASDAGAYSVTVTNAQGSATSAAATLTVVPRSAFAGSYFGTFGSGGAWGLHVRDDGTAVLVADLRSRQSALVVEFSVAADGTFDALGAEMRSSLQTPAGGRWAAAPLASDFSLTGQIGGNGAIAGNLTGLGETFSGALDAANGAAHARAGYYTATALAADAGETYLVIGPSGQAVAVVTAPGRVESAAGIVDAGGQLAATSGSHSSINVAVGSAGENVSVSVLPAGAAAAIRYAGLSDRVAPVARFTNLSIRSRAGAGSQTLIVGFVVNGAGTMPLLVRGIGPALSAFGVTNAVPDPRLRLFDAHGTEVDGNDNWNGSLALRDEFRIVGAFEPAADSKDAALYSERPAGAYTFHAVTNDGTEGVALAELYVADAGPGTTDLVNISARTYVGTGDDVLIAGFVVAGNAPKRLLIRGLGPTLAGYGVTGVLANPVLRVFEGGTEIALNDDWQGGADLKAAFATVGAAPMASDSSQDAALLITLEPGIYTAQVSGVSGSAGVALVEIFALP